MKWKSSIRARQLSILLSISKKEKWHPGGIKKKNKTVTFLACFFCTHTQHETKNFMAMTPEGGIENSKQLRR